MQNMGKSVKRTASQKNLTSWSDDNGAAPPKPKAGMIREKAKKTAICKKPAASDALLCCNASEGLSVENGSKTQG